MKLAPIMLEPMRLASTMVAFTNCAPARSWPARLAPVRSQLLQFTLGPGSGSETAPVPGAIVGQSAEGSTRIPLTTDQPEGKTVAGVAVDPVIPPEVMLLNVAPVKSDFPT